MQYTSPRDNPESVAPRGSGTKCVGFNYGLLQLAWGVAGILGPFLGGRVYVVTDEYRWAFHVAAAVSVAALGTLFLAKNPHAGPVRISRVRAPA